MKRILLFETAPQLKKLLRQFDARSSENRFVALSPDADYAAKCTGISYQSIEDFYDEAELIALGIENYKTTGDFCDSLDRIMRNNLHDVPDLKYLSAHQLFHSWKILFDAILNRTFALKAAVENINPEEIVSFKDVNIERRDGFGFTSSSAFRSVAPVVAEHYRLKLTQIPATFLDWQILSNRRQRASWLAYRLPGGSRFVDAWVWLARRRAKSTDSGSSKEQFENGRPVLVAAERGYNLDYVIAEWQRRGIGPVMMLLAGDSRTSGASRREGLVLKKKLTEMWRSAEFQHRLSPFFNINGLDCYPIAQPRIHFYLSYVLPQFLNRARFAHERLGKLEKAVVVGNLETVVCEVARHLGIPGVNYQHGGLCGYAEAPLFEHMELYAADYFFCTGEGTARFLAKPVPSAHRSPGKHRSQPIAIGSAVLDSLVKARNDVRLSSPPQKPRQVIYVSSGLMGDMRHHTYHLHPDIWYWRLQRDILTLFGRFPDVHFIAKLHPHEMTKNPIDDWFCRNPLPNVEIVRTTPFAEMLQDADLIIMEHPVTTLVQAVTTRKKIILYADRTFFHFDPPAAKLARKRMVFSETKEQFFQDMERVLGEADWTLHEPINDEFLKSYGTHLNDGRSAERAVWKLVELAEKSGQIIDNKYISAVDVVPN